MIRLETKTIFFFYDFFCSFSIHLNFKVHIAKAERSAINFLVLNVAICFLSDLCLYIDFWSEQKNLDNIHNAYYHIFLIMDISQIIHLLKIINYQ